MGKGRKALVREMGWIVEREGGGLWWCWAFESALMLGVTLCGTEMGERVGIAGWELLSWLRLW